MDIEVKHQPGNHKFAAQLEGAQEAKLEYEKQTGDVIDLKYTFVPEEFRGEGIASELVKQSLDIAREEDLKIVPSCPFVQNYVEEHNGKYEDIIAE